MKNKKMKEDFLDDYRCDCGKLLFKGSGLSGKIEIKCKRCGKMKTVCGKIIPFLCGDGEEKNAYKISPRVEPESA